MQKANPVAGRYTASHECVNTEHKRTASACKHTRGHRDGANTT